MLRPRKDGKLSQFWGEITSVIEAEKKTESYLRDRSHERIEKEGTLELEGKTNTCFLFLKKIGSYVLYHLFS